MEVNGLEVVEDQVNVSDFPNKNGFSNICRDLFIHSSNLENMDLLIDGSLPSF